MESGACITTEDRTIAEVVNHMIRTYKASDGLSGNNIILLELAIIAMFVNYMKPMPRTITSQSGGFYQFD